MSGFGSADTSKRLAENHPRAPPDPWTSSFHESGPFQQSMIAPIVHQMIGILAGMGPFSTGLFLGRVLEQCERQYGAQQDDSFPPMLIASWPTPLQPEHPTDARQMVTALTAGLRTLEGAGVSFIGIACNTAHAYFPALRATVTRPLLNMVQLAVDALPPQATRVAVVCSRDTAASGIYRTALGARGVTSVELPWQAEVDSLIGAARLTPDTVQRRFEELERLAIGASADHLVIACLDLSAAISSIPKRLPTTDSSQALASGLVRHWRETH